MENSSSGKKILIGIAVIIGLWWLCNSSLCSNSLKEVEMPANGKVLYNSSSGYCSGKMNFTSSKNDACYVKLKDYNDKEVFSFFVQPGKTVHMNVPDRTLRVYVASGEKWYGESELFGKDTQCIRDNDMSNFSLYEISYTMTTSYSSSKDSKKISKSDF